MELHWKWMDIPNKYILISFISTNLLVASSSLQKYKMNMKEHHNAIYINNTKKNIQEDRVIIRYYDINNLDIFKLKNKYKLELQECIADGLCIFKYNGRKSISKVIENIEKNENTIKNIRIYKKYKFKTL